MQEAEAILEGSSFAQIGLEKLCSFLGLGFVVVVVMYKKKGFVLF